MGFVPSYGEINCCTQGTKPQNPKGNTMYDADKIKHNFDLLSFIKDYTSLKKNGNYYVGPCPFCGGTDRFVLKQTSGGWLWLCRGCNANEAKNGYHDSISLVMKIENISFVEACKRMGGQEILPRGSFNPIKSSPPEIRKSISSSL